MATCTQGCRSLSYWNCPSLALVTGFVARRGRIRFEEQPWRALYDVAKSHYCGSCWGLGVCDDGPVDKKEKIITPNLGASCRQDN